MAALTNLSALVLNDNQLSSTIPADWSTSTYMSTLDISNNQLTGQLPPPLRLPDLYGGSCTSHLAYAATLPCISDILFLCTTCVPVRITTYGCTEI